MTVRDLLTELRKYPTDLKVYVVSSDGKARDFEVTWSAVDPSLGIPETVLLQTKEKK